VRGGLYGGFCFDGFGVYDFLSMLYHILEFDTQAEGGNSTRKGQRDETENGEKRDIKQAFQPDPLCDSRGSTSDEGAEGEEK
jgi:hypothetical protein